MILKEVIVLGRLLNFTTMIRRVVDNVHFIDKAVFFSTRLCFRNTKRWCAPGFNMQISYFMY